MAESSAMAVKAILMGHGLVEAFMSPSLSPFPWSWYWPYCSGIQYDVLLNSIKLHHLVEFEQVGTIRAQCRGHIKPVKLKGVCLR